MLRFLYKSIKTVYYGCLLLCYCFEFEVSVWSLCDLHRDIQLNDSVICFEIDEKKACEALLPPLFPNILLCCKIFNHCWGFTIVSKCHLRNNNLESHNFQFNSIWLAYHPGSDRLTGLGMNVWWLDLISTCSRFCVYFSLLLPTMQLLLHYIVLLTDHRLVLHTTPKKTRTVLNLVTVRHHMFICLDMAKVVDYSPMRIHQLGTRVIHPGILCRCSSLHLSCYICKSSLSITWEQGWK